MAENLSKKIKVHLDTDLGGDLDDLCALAYLLRSKNVEITGITSAADENGRRAGYIRYALRLEGREEIPVAAGADVSSGMFRFHPDYPSDARYWPEPVQPAPGPVEAALDLLEQSIESGAFVIAIGPLTNLYLLEQRRPGILACTPLVLMGGYIFPIRPGFPAWGNDMDYNLQMDVRAARTVIESAQPVIVPMTVTVETALRRASLPALRNAGALGRLVARQAEEFALDNRNEERYGTTCPGLPADVINFQHDPLACAIALGWNVGVERTEVPLRLAVEDGYLVERPDPQGRPAQVVTAVNGPAFNEHWASVVCGEG
jgi:purine nucleosidase